MYDDTNIFVKAKTRKQLYENAKNILDLVNKYMIANKLHINQTKCCYIEFRGSTKLNPEDSESFSLSINNNEIMINIRIIIWIFFFRLISVWFGLAYFRYIQ